MPRTAPAALLLAASLALAACTGTSTVVAPAWTVAPSLAPGATPAPTAKSASVVPVIISSNKVVGANRFVFSFLDAKTNLPVAGPDRAASVAFIAPGDPAPGTAAPAQFVWAIEGSRGEYILSTQFPVAGSWKAIFVTAAPGKDQEAIGVAFDVVADGPTIAVGEKAPASKTPTLASVGGDIKLLSTDSKPDPAFYQTSVAEAVAQGKPFVLVFATPAFCQSAQCGPTLDRVKAVAKDAPANIAFINVEPYKLTFTDGRLQPVLDSSGQLQPVDSVNDWQILSEPWIFTVDRTGVVRGSFEGVASDQELRDAIKVIAGS
ncbi:MAG: hypothetical protein WCK58_12030 [Chloroflexota bacterium]